MNFKMKFPNLCDRCGRPGHWGSDCTEPMDDAHLNLISVLVDLWIAGEITIDQKREAISAENVRYHGPGVKRELLWPR